MLYYTVFYGRKILLCRPRSEISQSINRFKMPLTSNPNINMTNTSLLQSLRGVTEKWKITVSMLNYGTEKKRRNLRKGEAMTGGNTLRGHKIIKRCTEYIHKNYKCCNLREYRKKTPKPKTRGIPTGTCMLNYHHQQPLQSSEVVRFQFAQSRAFRRCRVCFANCDCCSVADL